MARDTEPSAAGVAPGRIPPYSEEAEAGVLGSILLDANRVLDLCVERQLSADSFHVPAHRQIYQAVLDMAAAGQAIDLLTLTNQLRTTERLELAGGAVNLQRILDATPTAAHAAHYIEIVRDKHLLRTIIDAARIAEAQCFGTTEGADIVLSRVEQEFLNITERQHGAMKNWDLVLKGTMRQVETFLTVRRGLAGVSTGFQNLDKTLLGLKPAEMIIIAARPSMGKTSLAMNIAENVALGVGDPEHKPRPVGIFSLEMSAESLALRMLCSHAGVSAHNLTRGFGSNADHGRLMQAAGVLGHARIYLDDTGGLDVMELRARARRMWKKQGIQLVVVDYLQLLHHGGQSWQGRQQEIAAISSNLKAMAKELNLPVIVLSQLNRAPEQRDKEGKPKLSDLRDSGSIEQDADVVCMLRRPCKYAGSDQHEDETLAIVDVAKNRNGPTDEVKLNFEQDYTRFRDRTEDAPRDGYAPVAPAAAAEDDGGDG